MYKDHAHELNYLEFHITITVLLITLLIIRFYIRRSMIIPIKLYNAALQQENNGLFLEAQIGYMFALQEIKSKKKIQQSRSLKNLISEKLKTLQSVISYNTAAIAIA